MGVRLFPVDTYMSFCPKSVQTEGGKGVCLLRYFVSTYPVGVFEYLIIIFPTPIDKF